MKKLFLLISSMLIFSGCNNSNIEKNFPEDQNIIRQNRAGHLFGGKNGYILSENKKSKVNKKTKQLTLWQKSVNVISNLAPISEIDENLNIIITDWSNLDKVSNNSNNQYKINVIVKGDEIIRSNLQISVFKKSKNNNPTQDKEMGNKIFSLILNN